LLKLDCESWGYKMKTKAADRYRHNKYNFHAVQLIHWMYELDNTQVVLVAFILSAAFVFIVAPALHCRRVAAPVS
jgi:hypothetical protein